MAQVTGFVVCESQENVKTAQGDKVHAQGITSLFKMKYCPSLFSFSLIVALQDDDFSGSHSLIIKIINPEGNDFTSIPATFEDPKSSDGQPAHGLTLGVDFRNLEVIALGQYKVEVIYDNEIIGNFPLVLEGKE